MLYMLYAEHLLYERPIVGCPWFHNTEALSASVLWKPCLHFIFILYIFFYSNSQILFRT